MDNTDKKPIEVTCANCYFNNREGHERSLNQKPAIVVLDDEIVTFRFVIAWANLRVDPPT